MSRTRVDVFNGDADGLCAVRQWRLAGPPDAEPAVAITGLKREVALVERVPPGTRDVAVFDVSLDRNRPALERLLAAGARVRYFDHHFAGTIPVHRLLEAHIDTGAAVCTSAIVDRVLDGRHRRWAIVGAYGDNLPAVAAALADRLPGPLALDAASRARLEDLGTAINHNSYGESRADVLVAPEDLLARLAAYRDPLDFVADDPLAAALAARRDEDLARVRSIAATICTETIGVYRLPDAAWARRVFGTFANRLARAAPTRAHLVLRERGDGTFAASIRAPLTRPGGADRLARGFAGGGRAIAAGIDALAAADVERLVAAFLAHPWGT